MDIIIAEVHDLGGKINVKYPLLDESAGSNKSNTTSEFSRKDNIGRVRLENPSKDGLIINFKDNRPPLELNIENADQSSPINKQVKFIHEDLSETIVSNNLELQDQFLIVF